MLTPKRPCFFSIGRSCAFWSTHIRSSNGSSETDVTEFAVMPWTRPGARSAVTTVTPVAKFPQAKRNSAGVGVFVGILRIFEDIILDEGRTNGARFGGGVRIPAASRDADSSRRGRPAESCRDFFAMLFLQVARKSCAERAARQSR